MRRASPQTIRTRPARRHNLPAQLTSFVGREQETAEIRRLLRTTRLLTLVGAGGVGKTRLALEVAPGLVDEYADGVWLVQLASLADPALVPQAVATALGLHVKPNVPPVATVEGHLRDRQALLLLDNCEHLTVACADLVDRLLRSCPRLAVLATSREVLGIAGETAWRVPSLGLPDALGVAAPGPTAEQLVRLADAEAVRLFVDRAGNASPGFRPAREDAVAVAQICRQLDGIPLAIELAAARAMVLSPRQITARLDDRFRLLTSGNRSALPRHRTLRALVDWSYDLLSEPEQALLRRLSVFAGGWTLDAAETVGGGSPPPILDLLAQLVAKSLVLADERDSAGEVRYRLLETIRHYAVERLQESDEEDLVRRRHRDWFLTLAERAVKELIGPEQTIWYDRLEAEHDNFRAALHWSLTDPDGVEAGLRLGAVLSRFWAPRGFHREGRQWLDALLARPGAATAARADALDGAAHLAERQGDYAATQRLGEESLRIWRALGSKRGAAQALRGLGSAAHAQAQYESARALLQEAIDLAREAGDTQGTYRALQWLADMAYERGEHDRAEAIHTEALSLARERRDAHGIAYSLRGLGYVARARGEHERATALIAESLLLLRELRDRRCLPLCIEGLACVAGRQGQVVRAARLFGAAQALRDAIGVTIPPAERADHERGLAAVQAALNDERFANAWGEGQAMTLDQAAEYALAEPGRGAATAVQRAAGSRTDLLTPREQEVAGLIARGLSNSQIAAELVLSVRTVERHIENIYGKLGVHGKAARAAATAHVLGHRPAELT